MRALVSRPAKSPLKVQNGVQEADSPIKKVTKRSRQILDSDDEEAPAVKEQVATKEVLDNSEKVNAVLPAPPPENHLNILREQDRCHYWYSDTHTSKGLYLVSAQPQHTTVLVVDDVIVDQSCA